MVVTVRSLALSGISGYEVSVECFLSGGLPAFDIVGLGDTAVKEARERVRAALDAAIKHGAKYALVGNLGHIPLIEGTGLTPIGDFRLNITNRGAREAYAKLGIEDTLLSAELTLPMARDVGGGAIVYGRIPLMLTERCFMKENFGCDKCGKCSLTDP